MIMAMTYFYILVLYLVFKLLRSFIGGDGVKAGIIFSFIEKCYRTLTKEKTSHILR